METVYILRKLPFTSVKKTSPQIMHLPPSPPRSLRGVRFFGVNILPWKMVTGLSVRSRPSTLMEGAVFFFSNLTTGSAIFRSSFSSIWRCSASPTLLSSVTLGFTPVWAAMRSASRRSNCISCKKLRAVADADGDVLAGDGDAAAVEEAVDGDAVPLHLLHQLPQTGFIQRRIAEKIVDAELEALVIRCQRG